MADRAALEHESMMPKSRRDRRGDDLSGDQTQRRPDSAPLLRDSAGKRLPLVLLAAVARNGAIGGDGRLLWRLRSDMRRFRAITMGKPVLMGRKTWDSIGRPLPGRQVVVLTHDVNFRASGVQAAFDLANAIALAEDLARAARASEIIVAGGAEIYRQTIGEAALLRLTEVDLAPVADVFFPPIDRAVWRETIREAHTAGEDDEAPFAFVDYERRTPDET
jgi:dihydrofolate reductase